MIYGLGFRIWGGLGFGVWDVGLRIRGFGFSFQGSGFKAYGTTRGS